ncbi:hypothetical protein GP486_003204 [Trichoglossum hirsutum]|uniref:Uncharacterized protein n=1 Tax=Trichoglossum hirsutum TaxID=265104 RepID=A0A9P8RQZ7_9PEZI|nr:hypothetical protein GP486_003204 [Trichoglossum hirsutum]
MLSYYCSTTTSEYQPFLDTPPLSPLPLSAGETPAKKLSTAATRVVEAFRRHEDGRLDRNQLAFQLKRQEYQEVLDYLEQDYSLKGWVDCKIRYNYDPATRLLEIYMPTTIHEKLTANVAVEIKRFTQQFSAQCALPSAFPAFLNAIHYMASSDIYAHDDPHYKRSPDAAFSHFDDQFPGIVIETSYSQKAESVEKRADEYIMMSNGNIKMVIGFDVEYRSNNQRVDTISVWRPMHGQDQGGPFLSTECTLNREPFRDADTRIPINPNHTLTIPLSAFASTSTLLTHSIPLADHATTIVAIPFLTLANYVTEAQEWETKRRNLQGVMDPVVVGRRKRRRASTPPETLTREDERVWEKKEKLSERKAELEDGTWGE